MTCAEATPLVELELDGELDARSVLELREHVARCPSCTRQAAALRALSEAARAHLQRFEPPPGFEGRLLRRLRPRLSWRPSRLSGRTARGGDRVSPRQARVEPVRPRRGGSAGCRARGGERARIQLLALDVGRPAVRAGRRRRRPGDGSAGAADGRRTCLQFPGNGTVGATALGRRRSYGTIHSPRRPPGRRDAQVPRIDCSPTSGRAYTPGSPRSSRFIRAKTHAIGLSRRFSTATTPRFRLRLRTSGLPVASPARLPARSTKAIPGERRASATANPSDPRSPSVPAASGVTSAKTPPSQLNNERSQTL